MELNGVANMKMLLESGAGSDMPTSTLNALMEQLNLLERYMIAYGEHTQSIKAGAYGALIIGKEAPFWHEVRMNPEQFPNNRERIDNLKKEMEEDRG